MTQVYGLGNDFFIVIIQPSSDLIRGLDNPEQSWCVPGLSDSFDKLRVLAMTSSFIGHCEPDESGRGNLRDERLFPVMIS